MDLPPLPDNFDPLVHIPDGAAWIDFLDPLAFTTASGGTLAATVVNKVTGGSWAEATNRPAYSATAMNGRPGITGNGASSRIITTEALPVAALQGLQPHTMMVAYARTVSTASGTIVGAGSTAVGNNSRTKSFGQSPTANQFRIFVQNDANVQSFKDTAGVPADTLNHILVVRFDGAKVQVWDNTFAKISPFDLAGGAFAHGATTIERIALLCRPKLTPDGFSSGTIGEFRLYARALEEQEIAWTIEDGRRRWN